MKGEQGKPEIKPNKKKGKRDDYSSEQERRKRKKWQKGSKLNKVKIDREQVLGVNPSEMPADVVFKGYEAVVVQDLKIETDNVRFLKKILLAIRRENLVSPVTGWL